MLGKVLHWRILDKKAQDEAALASLDGDFLPLSSCTQLAAHVPGDGEAWRLATAAMPTR